MFQSWTQVDFQKKPNPRYGHCCDLNHGKMVICGGDNDARQFNDLHCLDLKNVEWSEIIPSKESNTPAPISGHIGFFFNESFYIHGGYFEGSFNDALYQFNFETNTWSLVKTKNTPKPRSYHTGILYQNNLVLFGGFVQENNSTFHEYCNEIYYLNFKEMTWELLKVDNSPSCRSGHTANLYKHEMIIFGGFGSDKCSDDFCSFDLRKQEWMRLEYYGQKIKRRFCHTSIIHHDDLYLYGGSDGLDDLSTLYCINLVDHFVKKMVTTDNSLSYHSMVFYKNDLILFGGDDNNETTRSISNNVWKIHIDYYTPFIKFEEKYFDSYFIFQ
jgi:leucine-zipper-like transcriptional regulator 1